jgi:hypothetical protein
MPPPQPVACRILLNEGRNERNGNGQACPGGRCVRRDGRTHHGYPGDSCRHRRSGQRAAHSRNLHLSLLLCGLKQVALTFAAFDLRSQLRPVGPIGFSSRGSNTTGHKMPVPCAMNAMSHQRQDRHHDLTAIAANPVMEPPQRRLGFVGATRLLASENTTSGFGPAQKPTTKATHKAPLSHAWLARLISRWSADPPSAGCTMEEWRPHASQPC